MTTNCYSSEYSSELVCAFWYLSFTLPRGGVKIPLVKSRYSFGMVSIMMVSYSFDDLGVMRMASDTCGG